MWYSETIHNPFSYKVLDISCCDGCQWFDLYPLGKIVYSHQKKLTLPLSWSKGFDDVHFSFHKWLWGENIVKVLRPLMRISYSIPDT